MTYTTPASSSSSLRTTLPSHPLTSNPTPSAHVYDPAQTYPPTYAYHPPTRSMYTTYPPPLTHPTSTLPSNPVPTSYPPPPTQPHQVFRTHPTYPDYTSTPLRPGPSSTPTPPVPSSTASNASTTSSVTSSSGPPATPNVQHGHPYYYSNSSQ
ncbi:hypothetical protein HMI55_004064 [Coelomomyces lativittatus]|nr:hypothetical protein HMI55_004064 [Coelomomyces lativittatus]